MAKCQVCAQTLNFKFGTRFCSEECMEVLRASEAEKYKNIRTCKWCKGKFPCSIPQDYCGIDCRYKAKAYSDQMVEDILERVKNKKPKYESEPIPRVLSIPKGMEHSRKYWDEREKGWMKRFIRRV